MTNEKMEQRLAAALEKTAPDDVSGVLSRCEERKGTVINMETKKTAKRKWTSLIAACLAVMLLGGGLFYQRANAVASVVSLDVNPSIELKVNRSEKVLVCTPLNEDAKAILADMGNGADLKGAKLDVAVNAIVGSLVRNGYLDSISSAIMISVEDKDTARAEKLQRELTSTVDGVLQTSESRASVLTQTLTQDAVLEPVLTYLLSAEDIKPYQLGLDGNQIYLSYRIHISDIFSDFAEEIQKNITDMAFKADEMDNYLADTFGCEFSEYAKKDAI